MLFIENKYTRIYYSIINRGISRNFRTKKAAKAALGYVEKHHIVPRSLGGDDSKSNLVFLTAREHFICHLLLIKMTIGDDQASMIFAIQNFRNRKKNKFGEYKIGGRIYEMIRTMTSAEMSKLHSGRTPWNKGLSQTKESNEKRSRSLKGVPHSEEHRKNNALSRIGKKRQYSEEGLKNIASAARARKGVSLTPEQTKNRFGNVWWNNGTSQTRAKIQPGPDFVRGRLT